MKNPSPAAIRLSPPSQLRKSGAARFRGFTLIELLVAMAITTLIVTILVSITSVSLDAWNRSRSEIRASRQAKAMADSMTRDFEALVIRKGNSFEWLVAEASTPSGGPKGNQSPNAASLVFFSAATDRYDGKIGTVDDLGGDVSTIAYELQYKDPIGDDSDDDFFTFVLYRKIVNPDETFEDLLGQADLKQAFSTYSNSVDDETNFICENVYQFTVTFHVDVTKAGSGGNPETFTVAIPIGQSSNSTDEFKISGNGIETTFSGNTNVNNAELRSGRLSAVEISLSVLTDFGLQQMRQRTFTSDAAKSEFIAKNSYQYTKLVPVPGS